MTKPQRTSNRRTGKAIRRAASAHRRSGGRWLGGVSAGLAHHAVLEWLEPRRLLDATALAPSLLADVTHGLGTQDSSPSAIVSNGQSVYFLGYNGNNTELYKSDGAAAGTTALATVPQLGSLSPTTTLTVAGGRLFYAAGDGQSGFNASTALWSSDGTTAGTEMLHDFGGSATQGFSSVAVLGDQFLFAVPTSNGSQLWVSDGTASGTTRLDSLPTGTTISSMAVLGNAVYFGITEGGFFETANQLWKSDGTATGTVEVAALPTGSAAAVQNLTAVGDKLFFATNDGSGADALWVSDGTTAGTKTVNAGGLEPGQFTDVGGDVYFTSYDSVFNQFLWKSDGTTAGTTQLAMFAAQDTVNALTNAGGSLFFLASSALDGAPALWTTDGTAAGTAKADTGDGVTFAVNATLTAVGKQLYFEGQTAATGVELWKTDGTAAGTSLVDDINSGPGGSYPNDLVNVSGRLFFAADDGLHGVELWTSDGSASGTKMVADLNTTPDAADTQTPLVIGGSLYFFVTPSEEFGDDTQLWKSDGTAVGTSLVARGLPAPAAKSATVANTHIVFAAQGGAGYSFWSSDGTAAGTVKLADIGATPVGFQETIVGDALFVPTTDTANPGDVWMTDGTVAGTHIVTQSGANGAGLINSSNLVGFNGNLYFTTTDINNSHVSLWSVDPTNGQGALVAGVDAVDGDHSVSLSVAGGKLWISDSVTVYTNPNQATFENYLLTSDGTTAGTTLVSQPSSSPAALTSASNFATINAAVVFQGSDSQHGDELWTTDGTSAGTKLLVDINAGAGNAYPANFTNINGTLVFTATDATGLGLWTTDGTAAGTRLLARFSSIRGTDFTEAGGKLFFTADDGTHGLQLWTTDGTAAGTTMLTSGATSTFTSLTNVGGVLYFVADGELWTSDGTVSGTHAAAVGAGALSGAGNISGINGHVFFTADDGVHAGTEPLTLVPFTGLLSTASGTVSAVEGGPLSNQTLATFIDATTGTTASAYSATINWGDGTSATAGTISGPDANGVFTVSGSHTYAEENTAGLPLKIVIGRSGTTAVTANDTAIVADAPLTVTGTTLSVQSNSAATAALATFKDPGGAEALADYSATVKWGDGGTSTGSMSGPDANGVFTVSGSHDYTAAGTPTITVVIHHDAVTPDATVQDSVSVSTAPLPVNGIRAGTLAATEGIALDTTVATFTDPNGAGAPSSYSATVDWGDGTSATTAAISGPGAGGVFTVVGAHTYAEEKQTSESITVVIGRAGSPNATVSDNTTIADAALSATASAVAATEARMFSGTVATFTDADPAGTVADYTAVINWGDASALTTVSGAQITESNGAFSVPANHVYAEDGAYTLTVTISDAGGATATVNPVATVLDSPINAAGLTITATEGQSFSGTVARFTDTNPLGDDSDFTATINWGDGTTTSGAIAQTGGSFSVSGSHTYTATGTFSVATTINDSGNLTVADGSAVVASATPFKLLEDTYVIGSGTINIAAAAGVLVNDTGPSQLTVTSGTVTGAEGGTFAFHADGSFTYTPPANFPGFDYAKYAAQDASGDSGTATVSVLSQPAGVIGKFFEQVLHRDPAPSDLAFFIPLLAKYGPGVLSADFFESDELLNQIITGYYQQYLGRAPQGTDLDFWGGKWRAYGGPELIIAQFASSAEFNTLANHQYGAGSAGWVTALYDRILDRVPRPGIDVPFWQQQLAGGTTEGQVALDFVASNEGFGDDVTGWFQEYLGRAPTATEQAKYVNEMLAGASDRAIEQEITNLPEYAGDPPAAPDGTGVRLPDYVPPWSSATQQTAAVSAKDAVFRELGK